MGDYVSRRISCPPDKFCRFLVHFSPFWHSWGTTRPAGDPGTVHHRPQSPLLEQLTANPCLDRFDGIDNFVFRDIRVFIHTGRFYWGVFLPHKVLPLSFQTNDFS